MGRSSGTIISSSNFRSIDGQDHGPHTRLFFWNPIKLTEGPADYAQLSEVTGLLTKFVDHKGQDGMILSVSWKSSTEGFRRGSGVPIWGRVDGFYEAGRLFKDTELGYFNFACNRVERMSGGAFIDNMSVFSDLTWLEIHFEWYRPWFTC